MKITYIIVDDEPLAREGIKINADKMPGLDFKGSFSSALQALDYLKTESIDLIFLDIEMPGLSGLEFLKVLDNNPLVILTTAYPQYALEAFELEVVDYLMKPIRIERFIRAVNRANEIIQLKSQKIKSHLEFDNEFIYIKSERKLIKLYLNDIIFIKGLKDYVIIHTKENKHLTAMNVKTIHGKLPSKMFARVSKSFIINITHMTSIENDIIWLGKEDIPLGKSYKSDFIKTYIDNKLVDRS